MKSMYLFTQAKPGSLRVATARWPGNDGVSSTGNDIFAIHSERIPMEEVINSVLPC